MGCLVHQPFEVHTSPSVYITEQKIPVDLGSLVACLDICPSGCHRGLPLRGVRGSLTDQLG